MAMNRSCPFCAATSAAARVSSSVLLMWSTVTWTSFFCSHCLIQVLSNQSSYAGTKCTHWMIERSPFRCLCLYFSGPANEYGAVAPAAPTAAAPTPARLSSSRRLIRSDMPPSFRYRLAEGSASEAGDEPIQEQVVDERQRDARDQDRGHDRGPVVEIAADQLGRYGDRQRAAGRARDESDRVQELVDDEREREDDDRQDPRECSEPRAAVDERSVLELERDRLEEAHQEPDRERHRERRIDEHERPQRPGEMDRRDHPRQR